MNWSRSASICMALSILLGAFGAHALKTKLDPSMMEVYKTAVLYQMIHGLALFAVAWRLSQGVRRAGVAGWLFLSGIILFSGSLYGLSLTGFRWLGAVTPLGGLAFFAGWVTLARGD